MFDKKPINSMNSQSGFSFRCGRCSRCCHHRKIQVNPYEIARLAANLQIGTTEFIQNYTDKGVYLSKKGKARCVFLEADGCRVYKDRPLVCRLYPLGRTITPHGAETFFMDGLPSGCCSKWSASQQTVGTYLVSQGVSVFMQASDYYRTLLRKLADALQQEYMTLPHWLEVSHGSEPGMEFPEMLDPDGVIVYDGTAGSIKELTPWDKMIQHVSLVEKWLNETRNVEKEVQNGKKL